MGVRVTHGFQPFLNNVAPLLHVTLTEPTENKGLNFS